MNEIYGLYKSSILTGFGFMHVEAGDVYMMLAMLAGFSIVLGFLISPKEVNIAQPAAWGIMAIGLGLFIDSFPTLSQKFAGAMWEVGSSATGGAGISDFEDFDGLMLSGYEMAKPIISSLHGWGPWEIFSRFEDWAWGWISIAILMLTNAYLAFRLFILMLSYLTMSLVAMVSFPAMMWNRSAWIAEAALKFCAGTGVSILGFGIVLSVVWGAAAGIEFLADMTKGETLMNVGKTVVGFFLALRTQSLIQGYFSGGAQMGSGIGGTIRSGLHAMHAMQSMAHAARTVSSRINGEGKDREASQNRGGPQTSPNINPGAGGNQGNGFGGQWRQPNSGRAGGRP